MSEAKRTRKLPTIADDDTWTSVFAGETYRFREETLQERKEARKRALESSPEDPTIDENLAVLVKVMARKKPDGWAVLTVKDFKGPVFYGWAVDQYFQGIAALAKKWIPEEPSSSDSSNETSKTQQSANLVRP